MGRRWLLVSREINDKLRISEARASRY
jgi:hypothetical protein